nr:hypothetical protein [Tanacetum cinerariifolium]
MLHISPRIPSQSFAELPFKEEILEFLSDQQVLDWQELWHQQFQIISSTNSLRILSQKKREAAPKPKASARKKKYVERTKAEQLKIVLKRSRQETHISQQRGSGTDEGTGSRPGVPDVPSD